MLSNFKLYLSQSVTFGFKINPSSSNLPESEREKKIKIVIGFCIWINKLC